MVERLGNVVYWACCVVAGFFLLIAASEIFAALNGEIVNWRDFLDPWARWQPTKILPTLPQNLFLAAVVWGLGKAVRYVLSGQK